MDKEEEFLFKILTRKEFNQYIESLEEQEKINSKRKKETKKHE